MELKNLESLKEEYTNNEAPFDTTERESMVIQDFQYLRDRAYAEVKLARENSRLKEKVFELETRLKIEQLVNESKQNEIYQLYRDILELK